MQRHLGKKKKCNIINITDKSEEELNNESLIFHSILDGLNLDIKLKSKKFICNECDSSFHNNSNLLRHKKSSKSCNNFNNKDETNINKDETNINKDETNINKDDNNISDSPLANTLDNSLNSSVINNNIQNITNNNNNSNNNNNIIQNITNNNNIINININPIKGFDEKWNTSNISNEMREKILLGETKFTNTLKNILNNNENLNVIIKDNEIGIVFNIKNNEYEPMNVKEILDKSMDKIYIHLSDFFNEIIVNKKIDKKIMKDINEKYKHYKRNKTTNDAVNNDLTKIFDYKKDESIKKFIKINDDDEVKNDYNY